MTSNVREINPANLRDVPKMLRFWAAEFEAGREPMPRTAMLLLIHDMNSPPSLCSFGDDLGALAEIGALQSAIGQCTQCELVPVTK